VREPQTYLEGLTLTIYQAMVKVVFPRMPHHASTEERPGVVPHEPHRSPSP
jgi:hypothetical protein